MFIDGFNLKTDRENIISDQVMSLPIALCPIFSLMKKCSLQDKWMWLGCQNFLWLSQLTNANATALHLSLHCSELRMKGNQQWWTRPYWGENELTKPGKKYVYDTIQQNSICPWTAFQGKDSELRCCYPLLTDGESDTLKRLSFLVIVKQPPKQSQGEYLQGCRLGAVPIKLDDVHSSLTALGENDQ